ncbi:abnormal pharyngeal pumping eat-20-like [Watersipora subatra]|uniref:abnormal pharyngeal pumping eat-20-like n=1 Tax=Watersipora subatra TaxID=2589382 RepID=UPI00355B8C23
MKVLLVVCSVLAAVNARVMRRPKFAPSGPLDDTTVDICYDGSVKFLADKDNLCWYWECVETSQNNEINIQLLPRRCALGSKMPYTYTHGLSNPCSFNFNTKISFECTRADDQSVHKEPECFKDFVCHNNGTATYEGSVCWCDCPEAWSGNFDCSIPKQKPAVLNATSNGTECADEVPPCSLPNNFCANNGTCHNLCGDFWCECPVPFTNGKRCEGFSCDTNPCQNGGTCDRGEGGISEVSRCACPPGFHGFLCELGRAQVRSTIARQPFTSPTQPPVTDTQPFTNPTQPPVTDTQPFANPTQPPVTDTQPFTNPTQPPVTDTQPFTNPTLPPVTTTQPFTNPTQPPVTTTQPFTSPTQPPVTMTQFFTSSRQPFVSNTQSFTSPTQPLVTNTQFFTSPTQPPVTATQPLITASDPIVTDNWDFTTSGL